MSRRFTPLPNRFRPSACQDYATLPPNALDAARVQVVVARVTDQLK
jgi:hypothetical protein